MFSLPQSNKSGTTLNSITFMVATTVICTIAFSFDLNPVKIQTVIAVSARPDHNCQRLRIFRSQDSRDNLLMSGNQIENLAKKSVDKPDSCNQISQDFVEFNFHFLYGQLLAGTYLTSQIYTFSQKINSKKALQILNL